MSEQSRWKLEIKISGKASVRHPAEYQPVWINWQDFRAVRKTANTRQLITSDVAAFEILRGKRRRTVLESMGFDPDSTQGPDVPEIQNTPHGEEK